MDERDPRRHQNRVQGRGLLVGAGPEVIRHVNTLPALYGEPVLVRWSPSLRAHRGRLHSGPGPGDQVHAATFPRQRVIVFDSALRRDPVELARIVTHELFHFVWLRLGNPARKAWESLLQTEIGARARGELGLSASWRKDTLTPDDIGNRSRPWREYACESFCDTAAWCWSGVIDHAEYALAARWRARRKQWLGSHLTEPFRI